MRDLQIIIITCVVIVGNVQVKAFPSDAEYHKCGLAAGKRQPRIINGTLAEASQVPWIVSIKDSAKHRHSCGGTIISKRFILSAGHCFTTYKNDDYHVATNINNVYRVDSDVDPSVWEVTLGEYNKAKVEDFSVTRSIKQIIFHHKFIRTPVQNDIALLELNEDIKWTDHIQPMCLPQEDVETSAIAIAAGWGSDGLTESVTKEDNDRIRFIEIPIYNNDQCQKFYDSRTLPVWIRDTEMCAGRVDEIHDTSNGDSGGPLYIRVNGRAVLLGITSKGTPENSYPKMPAIYTRVYKYLDWIYAHIHGESKVSPELSSNQL